MIDQRGIGTIDRAIKQHIIESATTQDDLIVVGGILVGHEYHDGLFAGTTLDNDIRLEPQIIRDEMSAQSEGAIQRGVGLMVGTGIHLPGSAQLTPTVGIAVTEVIGEAVTEIPFIANH